MCMSWACAAFTPWVAWRPVKWVPANNNKPVRGKGKNGMRRRWRFVYDDKSTGQWAWQVHENMRLKVASFGAFPTLDRCISHARENGFSFAQDYDIVFCRDGLREREAGV